MDSIDIHKERKRLGLTQKELAEKIGVSYQTIQNWENGKVIPKSKYQIIGSIFKESDVAENKNLIPIVTENKGAPYYDVDFVGGFDLVVNNQTINPTFYIDFMPYNDVDCWVNVTGKSMSPFISHGDLVALKKVENWKEFLLFGEIYAIVTKEFRTIKIIGKSDLLNHFKLIPYSKSPEFSEQDLPIKFISNVYRVKGSIKKFF